MKVRKIYLVTLTVFLSTFVVAEPNVDLQYITTKYLLQNYQEAIFLLNSYKAIDSNERVASDYLTALCYLKLNLNRLAREKFEKVLEVFPDQFEVLNNIGVSYYQEREYVKALKYFHLSFISNTSFDIAKKNYNLLYPQVEKGDLNGEEVPILPFEEKVSIYCTMGWFYYYLNDIPNSIYYFKKSISEDSNYLPAYIALGYVYDVGKNYKSALEYLEKAALIDSNNPDLLNNLAIVAYHLGDFARAKENFQKAIGLNSSFTEPYNNLGWLFYDEKKYDLSAEYFERAIQMNHNQFELLGESYAGFALVKFVTGEEEVAKEYRERAITLNFRLGNVSYLKDFVQWNPEILRTWQRIE